MKLTIRNWATAQRLVMQFAQLLHILLGFSTRFFYGSPSIGVTRTVLYAVSMKLGRVQARKNQYQ